MMSEFCSGKGIILRIYERFLKTVEFRLLTGKRNFTRTREPKNKKQINPNHGETQLKPSQLMNAL